jgi:hypothetical protein
VTHLGIGVIGVLLADYSRIQLLSFFQQKIACPASVLLVFAILFCFVRAYEEDGSARSSLSCNESVLCCTWLPGVECTPS